MDNSCVYVGVDVGHETFWAVTAGQKARQFDHTPAGVRALVAWVRRHVGAAVPLHVCCEATGIYSRTLAVRLLAYPLLEVSIVNPAQVAAFGQAQLRRTKTDAVDAQVIFDFACSQRPRPWTPEAPALRELSLLVAQADALRANLRQWQNRIHAHRFAGDAPTAVRHSDTVVVRCLRRQLAQVEGAIRRLWVDDATLSHQVQLLTSIPGVAETTAVRLIAYGKTALTDRSARALTAHAGLAPRHKQSGTSVHGKSRLAKHGHRHLRRSLYMPTLVAIVHNPRLRADYQRLLAQGKPKMLAVAACMRKLLLLAQAVLKNQQPFNPTYGT